MIKKTVTYDGPDGPVEKELYFHLSTPQLVQLGLIPLEEGGEVEFSKIIESGDPAKVMTRFEDILCTAYGERTGENNEFTQSPEISDRFRRSMAYGALADELVLGDAADGIAFVQGMIPKKLAQRVNIANPAASATDVSLPEFVPAPGNPPDGASGLKNPRDTDNALLPWAFREPTPDELRTMDRDHLLDVMMRRNGDWTPPA